MINALESLNLTQRSQSNAKKMSWDERECFGLAQYAHKYVKCPRVGVKSRPTCIYIYRHTPSNRAAGKILWATDASIAHPTDVVPASVAPPSATRPRAFKLQRSHANPTNASFANDHGVSRVDGRCPESSQSSVSPDRCVYRSADGRYPASVANVPEMLMTP
jgi:hypothetical protein